MTGRRLVLLVVLLGCRPQSDEGKAPDCPTLEVGVDDLPSHASASVSGQGDWSVYSSHVTWADLDQDGFTDAVLSWYADDDPETTGTEPWVRDVGWARGPFVDHQTPEVLVKGLPADPFRSARVGGVGVHDLDGDGVMDILIPFEESPGSWHGLGESGLPERQAAAWFGGPFSSLTPRSLGDERLVEVPTAGAVVGDFDNNGFPDALLCGDTDYWYWLAELDGPPDVNEAATTFEVSQVVTRVAYVPGNPAHPFELRDESGLMDRYYTEEFVTEPDLAVGGSLSSRPRHDPYQDAGDLDSDGVADRIVAGPGDPWTLEVALSSGGTAALTGFPSSEVFFKKVGDFDGDGHEDMLVQLRSEDVYQGGPFDYWLLPGPFEARDYGVADATVVFRDMNIMPIGDTDGDGSAELALDQPGWPDGDRLEDDRAAGRIWILTGADLRDALACDD